MHFVCSLDVFLLIPSNTLLRWQLSMAIFPWVPYSQSTFSPQTQYWICNNMKKQWLLILSTLTTGFCKLSHHCPILCRVWLNALWCLLHQVRQTVCENPEDNIPEHGTPTKLVSDHVQVELSGKVQDILHSHFIGNWQSEPHQQHQNLGEHCFQTVKITTKLSLNILV